MRIDRFLISYIILYFLKKPMTLTLIYGAICFGEKAVGIGASMRATTENFLKVSAYGFLKMTCIGKPKLPKFGYGKIGLRSFKMMILESTTGWKTIKIDTICGLHLGELRGPLPLYPLSILELCQWDGFGVCSM